MVTTNDKNSPLTFGGETFDILNEGWETLPGGFAVPHRSVHGQVGLYLAVLSGKVMYIGCSIQLDRRLQQIRSDRELASNSHYGARKVREHIRDLDLQVLLLGRGAKPKTYVYALKSAMLRHWRPAWNVPQILAGKRRK